LFRSDRLFLEEVEKISKIVKVLIKEKDVKLISQFDVDGCSSCAILSKMLLRENVNFEAIIVKQLTGDIINTIEVDSNDFLIISDCGSGQLNLLSEILDKTQILILDHHQPVELPHLNLFHLNPLVFGEEEISASMVCYLLAKSINIRNTDLVDLALLGAIGDTLDEKWEFKGLAKKILSEAEMLGKVSINKGLRIYGQSRPLHQALAYSFDPVIPNISGSESQTVQFLSELGIPLRTSGEWKRVKDLTIEEQQKLASAIIKERLKSEDAAEDIFGDNYTILGKPDELQDAREFATLVNACGRTGSVDVAYRLCLNDYSVLEKSFEVLDVYRKLISEGLNWIRENENSVISTDFANYVLAGNKIPETIIGTITSIALNSQFFNSGKVVFGFAETDDTKIKISARIPKTAKQINLRDVLVDAVSQTGYEAGGHSKAAGAFIPKGKEQEFIKIVDKILGDKLGKKS
jgi:RecJ-like exonuclease